MKMSISAVVLSTVFKLYNRDTSRLSRVSRLSRILSLYLIIIFCTKFISSFAKSPYEAGLELSAPRKDFFDDIETIDIAW